jgi:hypothetical protein
MSEFNAYLEVVSLVSKNKKLEQKLEIAVLALKEIEEKSKTEWEYNIAFNALKELEVCE